MAAAVALVRRGCRPTMLDAGLTPEPIALTSKARLAAAERENWDAEELAALKRTGPFAANGIPRKLYFGSDFAFRHVSLAAPLESRSSLTSVGGHAPSIPTRRSL